MSKRRQKRRRQSASSLAIPIVVGVVTLTIVVGAIALSEARLPQTAAGETSGTTAQPLSTRSIPYPNVPRMPLQEARDKLDSGQALLVDVRSKVSYDKSHAVGAVSIPEAEIGARLNELPRDKEIILYCT